MSGFARVSGLLLVIAGVMTLATCTAPFDTSVVARVTDTGAPVLEITSPADGDAYMETVVVTGTVTDDMGSLDTGGLMTVTYEVSGSLGVLVSGTVETIDEEGGFTFSFDTVTIDGPISITVTATDWNLNATSEIIGLIAPVAELPSFTVQAGNQRVDAWWAPVPGATGYTLRYTDNGSFPTEEYGYVETFTENPTENDSFRVNGAHNGSLYVFRLEAELPDSTLSSDYKTVIPLSGLTLAPVVTPGYRKITLVWDDIPATNQYEVFRASTRNGSYLNLSGIVTGTTHTDLTVETGETYFYKVRPALEDTELSAANEGTPSPFPDSIQAQRSEILLSGDSDRVAVGDGFTVVAAGTNGVHIINTANRDNAYLATTYTRSGIDAVDVAVRGTTVFISDAQDSGSSTDGAVLAVDVSTLTSPTLLDSVAVEHPGELAVSDDYTFVTDSSQIVRIIYSADPANLGDTIWQWSRDMGSGPRAVHLAVLDGDPYDNLFVADDTSNDPGYGGGDADFGYVHRVRITDYDVSPDPDPTSNFTTDMYQSKTFIPGSLAVTDTHLFIHMRPPAVLPYFYPYYVESIDITDMSLAGASSQTNGGGLTGLAISGNRLFAADGWGLRMHNISDRTNPVSIDYWDTPGDSRAVAVRDNRVYVPSGDLGLQSIDVTAPGNLQVLGTYPGRALDLEIVEDVAYLAMSDNTVISLDVSDPESPVLLDTLEMESPLGLAASGTYLFVANGADGLTSVDISDPSSLTILGGAQQTNFLNEITILGDYAYTVGTGGFQIFNISFPVAPEFVGFYDAYSTMRQVQVRGDIAYVSDSSYFEPPNVFHVLDVSDPGTPLEIDEAYNTILGSMSELGDIRLSGDVAFITDRYFGGSGFVAVDINPDSAGYLTEISSLNTTGPDEALEITGNYVFLGTSDPDNAIRIIDVRDPGALTVVESIGWANASPSEIRARGKYVYVADDYFSGGQDALKILDALPDD